MKKESGIKCRSGKDLWTRDFDVNINEGQDGVIFGSLKNTNMVIKAIKEVDTCHEKKETEFMFQSMVHRYFAKHRPDDTRVVIPKPLFFCFEKHKGFECFFGMERIPKYKKYTTTYHLSFNDYDRTINPTIMKYIDQTGTFTGTQGYFPSMNRIRSELGRDVLWKTIGLVGYYRGLMVFGIKIDSHDVEYILTRDSTNWKIGIIDFGKCEAVNFNRRMVLKHKKGTKGSQIGKDEKVFVAGFERVAAYLLYLHAVDWYVPSVRTHISEAFWCVKNLIAGAKYVFEQNTEEIRSQEEKEREFKITDRFPSRSMKEELFLKKLSLNYFIREYIKYASIESWFGMIEDFVGKDMYKILDKKLNDRHRFFIVKYMLAEYGKYKFRKLHDALMWTLYEENTDKLKVQRKIDGLIKYIHKKEFEELEKQICEFKSHISSVQTKLAASGENAVFKFIALLNTKIPSLKIDIDQNLIKTYAYPVIINRKRIDNGDDVLVGFKDKKQNPLMFTKTKKDVCYACSMLHVSNWIKCNHVNKIH